MWEGSMNHDLPALNLRHVGRHIYEWHRGKIPMGHTLARRDHRFPECADLKYECRHRRCVNPWHVEPIPNRRGIYKREVEWDGTTTEHTLHYLHTQRARTPRRKEQHDHDGDSQGDNAVGRGASDQGTGMEESGVGEQDRA